MGGDVKELLVQPTEFTDETISNSGIGGWAVLGLFFHL